VRWICLDTSTRLVTCAVVEDGVTLGSHEVEAVNGHGELLAPAIADLLRVHGRQVDAVACGLGPGPYTSLRVGIATATALAQARGVPTHGAPSLDLVGGTTTGAVLVVQDARRKEVFWARYADGVRTDGPHVSKPADLDPDGALVVGDSAVWPSARPALPHADRLWGAPLVEHLVPLYLREPDAVPPGPRKRAG
jgi:tRNA threonylcarbamoyl adenosine modification protein YeaZ